MKLKIGGHLYKVVLKNLDKENELASCDYNKATISIDKNIVIQSIKESALIHEILHACNSTFGYDGVEHGLLDSLAEQLYQVLKDNDLLNQKTLDKLLTP